jgi:hypothetical protein
MYRSEDTAWKFWFYTTILLFTGIYFIPLLLWWAVLLSGFQVVFYWQERHSPEDLAVQVRICYLALMVAGFVPGYGWIHTVQLVGTTVMVTFGYCIIARVLALMPWNRQAPLDVATLNRILLSPPSQGNIMETLNS